MQYKEDLSESQLSDKNIPYVKKKILILGGQKVGKTSIMNRFNNNTFSENYQPTIQSSTKKVITFNNKYIDLEIVDLEGQTEYTIFSSNQFAFGYNAYMLVYDVTDNASFELIKIIHEKISNLAGKNAKILVATKCDKNINTKEGKERMVSDIDGKEFAEQIHCPYIEVSSKDNENIEEAFRLLLFEVNKIEYGVNLTKLQYKKIFELFIHHPKLMTIIFIIVLILLLLLSIYIIFKGIYKELEKESNYYFGIGFLIIILGFWIIVFSILGIIGICYKNIFFLRLNYFGSLAGYIIIFISIMNNCIINIINSIEFNIILEEIIIISALVCILTFTIIVAKTFKIIYKENLVNFIP